MKLTYAALCLCLVLGTGFSLVSAKNAAASDAAPLLAQPTEAPLLMSTAKPTLAPKKAPSPTKAMVMNLPPKMPHKPAEEQTENKMEMEMEKEKEQLPKKTTAVKSASSKSELQAAAGKPVPVSGFITRNGNIFEIEGEDGIGLIESRQNPSEDNESTNVCNYGSVVIYSDVPCDEVTNVHVSDVKETQIKEGSELGAPPQQEAAQSPASQAAPANDLPHDATTLQALEDVEIEEELHELEKEQRRRRKQNRRRQGNGNRRQSNKNRGQSNSQRRGGQQQQLTRRQQQNRRRQQQNRREQQQNRNRQQNRRRQHNNSYSNSNRNRNRNRNRDRDEVYDREQEYHRGRGV